MYKLIHLIDNDALAKILTNVDPKIYRKYITEENYKPVIYVKQEKSLCHTVSAFGFLERYYYGI